MQDKGRCGRFLAKGMEGAGDTTPLTKRRPRDYMGKEWSNAATSQGPPESQMENSSNQDSCAGPTQERFRRQKCCFRVEEGQEATRCV